MNISEYRQLRSYYQAQLQEATDWPIYPNGGAECMKDGTYLVEKVLSQWFSERRRNIFSIGGDMKRWLNHEVNTYLDLFGPGHLDLFSHKSKVSEIIAVIGNDKNPPPNISDELSGRVNYQMLNYNLYNPKKSALMLHQLFQETGLPDLITCTPFAPFFIPPNISRSAEQGNYTHMLKLALFSLAPGGVLVSQIPRLSISNSLTLSLPEKLDLIEKLESETAMKLLDFVDRGMKGFSATVYRNNSQNSYPVGIEIKLKKNEKLNSGTGFIFVVQRTC